MKILMVDDSSAITTLGKRILNSAGYTAESISDGYQAMSVIEATKFDCIILDVEMPILDGLNLSRLLTEHDQYKHIPKIFLSSNSGEFDRAKGDLCGANQYVVKPFDKHSLLEAIKEVLHG
jgi:twitching motility two-component system response regulator PilG